jgi:hypothetical protein
MTHTEQLEQLYVFAVYMLGSRDEAFAAVCDATAQHPGAPSAGSRPSCGRSSCGQRHHGQSLRRARRHPAHQLHDPDRHEPPARARRRPTYGRALSELKRSCLLSTLRGLTPERRAVFILRHVLGLPIETCAAVCDTTVSAMTVSEGRGRRDLEGYLGARCEHMDPGNACRCAARLGNALDRGLVRWPSHHEHDVAPLSGETYRQVRDLYASLPQVRLPISK